MGVGSWRGHPDDGHANAFEALDIAASAPAPSEVGSCKVCLDRPAALLTFAADVDVPATFALLCDACLDSYKSADVPGLAARYFAAHHGNGENGLIRYLLSRRVVRVAPVLIEKHRR